MRVGKKKRLQPGLLTVAQMHACISKSNTCQCCSQQHLALCLHIIRVPDRARKVLDTVIQRLQREDVTNRVGTLVSRSQDGILGPRRPLMVRDGSPALERVAQHVEAGARLDGGGHGARVEGVAYAEGGLEVAVGDAGLGALGDQVEDGGAGGLGPGACGRGDGDEGLQGLVDGAAVAEGRVYKVQEVGVRVRGVQVNQFGCVDDRATSHCQERIRVEGLGPVYGLADAGCAESVLVFAEEEMGQGLRAILWLDPCLVEDFKVDALVGQCLSNLFHSRQFVDSLVSNDTDPLGAHVLEVHADFARYARSESDGRGSHLKGILLELRAVLRGCIAAYSSMWAVSMVMMVTRVGVAWTRRRMSELNGPEQIHCPRGSLPRELSVVKLARQMFRK